MKNRKLIMAIMSVILVIMMALIAYTYLSNKQKHRIAEYNNHMAFVTRQVIAEDLLYYSLVSNIATYCSNNDSDINTAYNYIVSKLYSEDEVQNMINMIIKDKAHVDESMYILQNPPKGYSESYNKLMQTYPIFNDKCNLMINPPDNVYDFLNSIDLDGDYIVELVKEIYELHPELKNEDTESLYTD